MISFRFSFNINNIYCEATRGAHMAKSWASRHDSGLIDGHCVFGEIGNNGMAGLMVGCDGFVVLVDDNAPPLRALYEKDKIKKEFK